MRLYIQKYGDRWFVVTREYGTMFSRTGYDTEEQAQRVVDHAPSTLDERAKRRVELGYPAAGIDGIEVSEMRSREELLDEALEAAAREHHEKTGHVTAVAGGEGWMCTSCDEDAFLAWARDVDLTRSFGYMDEEAG